LLAVSVGAAVALVGCGGAGEVRGTSGPASGAAPGLAGGAVPAVDRSRHNVRLGDVVFDTFNGGFVRLDDALPGLISSERDAIRPVYHPRYGSALPGLKDEDLVIGYASGRGAYAYPVKVLERRELVDAVIDGRPVLVSYCPLCGSGVVYSRVVRGRTLLFGNTSALYQSDLVMYDYETGSYWFQAAGEAIVGTLTGQRLHPLPSVTMRWGRWRRLHSGTRLLVADGGERFGGG
jgi:hypothetical protein